MIYYVIAFLLLLVYFRYFGPIVLKFERLSDNALKPRKILGLKRYALFSVADVTIPVNQWRQISTGIGLKTFSYVFGNVVARILTVDELALKRGIRNYSNIIYSEENDEIIILMFNHYKYPVRIHVGDKIALIEFYRVSSVWML